MLGKGVITRRPTPSSLPRITTTPFWNRPGFVAFNEMDGRPELLESYVEGR